VAQVNLNNRLCSVLHAVCLVPVATLCVMLSLMLCCPTRALGYTDALLSRPCAWLHALVYDLGLCTFVEDFHVFPKMFAITTITDGKPINR